MFLERVNNQIEVNDQLKHSGGDDENTTKAQKLTIRHSQWLFTGSFFNELKLWGKHLLMTYVYFLTSLNYALKLLVESLFFNELELCDNIARDKFACPQHNNTNQGACPPSFISFNTVVGMKVYLRDL